MFLPQVTFAFTLLVAFKWFYVFDHSLITTFLLLCRRSTFDNRMGQSNHPNNTNNDTIIEIIELRGLNYTPRKGPESLNNIAKECKNSTEIHSDFQILTQVTKHFHLYALLECNQAEIIIPIAKEMGFKVFLNLWVDGTPLDNPDGSFTRELIELEHLLASGVINKSSAEEKGVVMGISVGSESYHRHQTSIEENIAYLEIVRDTLYRYNISDIPLTVTDIDKTFMQYPILMEAVDFASINAFPFFDPAYGKRSADRAISYLNTVILDPLLEEANKDGKLLYLTETGW